MRAVSSKEGDADGIAPIEAPPERSRPHHRRKRWTTIEKEIRALHGPLIAGVDEVGRGPLAGPVVACAVIMPPDMRAIAGVDDSKQLTADQRVRLAVKIRARALDWALGAASVREIERLNIYQASVLAMRRALGRLKVHPDHVLIDGNTMRTLRVPHTAIVHGDARCFSIACASIIAKVTRDYLMTRLALRHPGYTWERNVGYTTRAHIAGLASLGITRHHRRSFFRVSQLVLQLDDLPVGEDMIATDTFKAVLPTAHELLALESLASDTLQS